MTHWQTNVSMVDKKNNLLRSNQVYRFPWAKMNKTELFVFPSQFAMGYC